MRSPSFTASSWKASYSKARDLLSFVVIAHPALEADIAARARVEQLARALARCRWPFE